MKYIYSFILKFKKRLLLRCTCIYHFSSDLINNMDHMRISQTEPDKVHICVVGNIMSNMFLKSIKFLCCKWPSYFCQVICSSQMGINHQIYVIFS